MGDQRRGLADGVLAGITRESPNVFPGSISALPSNEYLIATAYDRLLAIGEYDMVSRDGDGSDFRCDLGKFNASLIEKLRVAVERQGK